MENPDVVTECKPQKQAHQQQKPLVAAVAGTAAVLVGGAMLVAAMTATPVFAGLDVRYCKGEEMVSVLDNAAASLSSELPRDNGPVAAETIEHDDPESAAGAQSGESAGSIVSADPRDSWNEGLGSSNAGQSEPSRGSSGEASTGGSNDGAQNVQPPTYDPPAAEPAPEQPSPAPEPEAPAPPSRHICRLCNIDITGNEDQHIKNHMLAGEDASWYPA